MCWLCSHSSNPRDKTLISHQVILSFSQRNLYVVGLIVFVLFPSVWETLFAGYIISLYFSILCSVCSAHTMYFIVATVAKRSKRVVDTQRIPMRIYESVYLFMWRETLLLLVQFIHFTILLLLFIQYMLLFSWWKRDARTPKRALKRMHMPLPLETYNEVCLLIYFISHQCGSVQIK